MKKSTVILMWGGATGLAFRNILSNPLCYRAGKFRSSLDQCPDRFFGIIYWYKDI